MTGKCSQYNIVNGVANIAIGEQERSGHNIFRNPPQYQKIRKNRTIKPVKFKKSNERDLYNDCKCNASGMDACGPQSQCINYSTSTECSASCKAGIRCQNQNFTRGISRKLQVKHFGLKGWGLITLESIARKTFIIEYVGDVINADELERRKKKTVAEKASNFYFLSLGENLYIDARTCGNDSRFINHSCEPNCSLEKWTVGSETRIGFFAANDIPPVRILAFTHYFYFLLISFIIFIPSFPPKWNRT